MPSRLAGAVALLMLLGLAGCGAGSSGSGAGATSPTVASTTPPASATASTVSSSSTASSSSSASTTSARLARATGYASYEGCAGTCTGSVPAALRRALNLPAADGGPCPITLRADGPVSPSTSTEVGFASVAGSSWSEAQVTWTAGADYTGPVLIRGGEVGGGALGFGDAATPYDELQLLDAGLGAPTVTNGGRAWITDTRIQTSGCYAYQVDGTTFSEVIVFRAIT